MGGAFSVGMRLKRLKILKFYDQNVILVSLLGSKKMRSLNLELKKLSEYKTTAFLMISSAFASLSNKMAGPVEMRASGDGRLLVPIGKCQNLFQFTFGDISAELLLASIVFPYVDSLETQRLFDTT